MKPAEHYYTAEFYHTAGMDPFLAHVGCYLRGERPIPVSRTRSLNSHPVFFTFSDPLLRQMESDPRLLRKPYEVALKYGFRGHSRGGKNGICFLREDDSKLQQTLDQLCRDHQGTITKDLDIPAGRLDSLRPVKIVCHNPQGERVVGVYNTTTNRIVFLDVARY